MDLSVPYYAITILKTAQEYIEQQDPLIQVAIAAAAIALVTQGSLVALSVGLAVIIYLRLWYLEAGPVRIGLGKARHPGDASEISNTSLMDELKELDPADKYAFLYTSPELFHLLHQTIFMRRLAKESFERVLEAADSFLEGSSEIKKTDNLSGVAVLIQQSIERAESVVKAYAAMGLHVPLSSDPELSSRFKDTLKAIRIVLRRDLVLLKSIAERHVNRSPTNYEPLPNIDGPRPFEY